MSTRTRNRKRKYRWSGVRISNTGKTWTAQCSICHWRLENYPSKLGALGAVDAHYETDAHLSKVREAASIRAVTDGIAQMVSPSDPAGS